MTPEQITILAILGAALVLFVWQRWRFDMVAVVTLLAAVAAGVVDPGEAFAGFGHPAVVTVAAVLAISRALANSGLVSLLATRVAQVARRPFTQRAALCAVAAGLSGFMNNVGALALMMPVAISTARRFGYPTSDVLMPIAFASILGGLITLIGTPPNIIVADYRRATGAGPFAMFDFTPVGLPLAVAGVGFIALLGWRLIPRGRRGRGESEGAFEVTDYLTEVRVGAKSEAVGKTTGEFERLAEARLRVLALIRGRDRPIRRPRGERLRPGDILVILGAAGALEDLIEGLDLELVAGERLREDLRARDLGLMEAVVTPRARIEGRTPAGLHLRSRHGVNVLAVARQGGPPIRGRLRSVRFEAGDVLLLQGEAEALPEVVADLGCLPLATRRPQFQPRRALVPLAIFGAAIAAMASGLLPSAVALTAAVAAMVLVDLLRAGEVYDSIDWPVIVLLGAMIPVGGAVETTGATGLIADGIVGLTRDASPFLVLALVLVATMTLSALMNNAATAVVMAPLAAGLADEIGADPDPFLMAVAVGASSAFLTPIGHQNNALVMGPGGYRFGDYWRLGLPLQILLVAIAVPLIPLVWPFA